MGRWNTLNTSSLCLTLDGLSTFFLLVEEEVEGTKVLAFLFNISDLTESLKSDATGNQWHSPLSRAWRNPCTHYRPICTTQALLLKSSTGAQLTQIGSNSRFSRVSPEFDLEVGKELFGSWTLHHEMHQILSFSAMAFLIILHPKPLVVTIGVYQAMQRSPVKGFIFRAGEQLGLVYGLPVYNNS